MVLKRSIYKFLYFSLLFCSAGPLLGQHSPQEYQIKAAFLFNFTHFIEWPDSVFETPGAPLVIGVLGEDPFDSYIDQIVAGEEANGHPLIVKRFKNVEEIRKCHILFINIRDEERLNQITEKLKGRSILTVGDTDVFIRSGGIIRFFMVNKKIQFQINPEAAKAADLTISSKVLRLAEIVVPDR